MKKMDGIKILGVVVTIGGAAFSVLSSFVDEKKTDAKIEEKVQKALTAAKI